LLEFEDQVLERTELLEPVELATRDIEDEGEVVEEEVHSFHLFSSCSRDCSEWM